MNTDPLRARAYELERLLSEGRFDPDAWAELIFEFLCADRNCAAQVLFGKLQHAAEMAGAL